MKRVGRASQFVLRIDTDNADFDGCGVDALKAIFDAVSIKIATGSLSGKVMGRNGNSVGEFVWTK